MSFWINIPPTTSCLQKGAHPASFTHCLTRNLPLCLTSYDFFLCLWSEFFPSYFLFLFQERIQYNVYPEEDFR
ncbi:hypothetical protein Krac_7484 [Ktedonobacter racemifer DSM 44963]|uniref:Uncharacterized protein n=1 Tax=Ktedonobacter racemifer DSM 44963 TaxID=485913 RepID=D6TK95_KTERA|nr:hypothetical protein Krac_7484 [Ktedonobacter racemifer DSM 44963]